VSEREALVLLDGAMEKYGIGRDQVAPLVAMKLDAALPQELFIFGEYPDGCVDVADLDGDVAQHVTREEAERMIREYGRS
jgi:hypothetical protein